MSDATRDDAPAATAAEAATAATTEATSQAAAPAEGATAPETTNSETAAAAPQSQPSLLATAGEPPAPEKAEAKPPEEAKAPDAKAPETEAKTEAAKPADAAPAPTEAPAEAPPAPKYDPFELPEGLSFEPERVALLTDELGKLEVAGKVDHATMQQFGQSLINLHTQEMTRAVDAIRQHQIDTWNATNQKWQDEVKSDPVIGGNRLETAMQVCGSVIEEFGGTRDAKTGEVNKDEVKALREALASTGAGNHPLIVKFVHRIGEALGEARPVVAPKPAAEPVRKADRLYGGTRKSD